MSGYVGLEANLLLYLVLKYEYIWNTFSRCPSLGRARWEFIVLTSAIMVILPNSTIHCETPMSEEYY